MEVVNCFWRGIAEGAEVVDGIGVFFYPEGGIGIHLFEDSGGEFGLCGEGVVKDSVEMFFKRFVFVIDRFH